MAQVRRAPSVFDGALAFPLHAGEAGKSGDVVLKCRVRRDGRPIDCSVYSEAPKGLGFGKAAMKLRSKMEVVPPAPGESPWVLIPFRWDGSRTLHIY